MLIAVFAWILHLQTQSGVCVFLINQYFDNKALMFLMSCLCCGDIFKSRVGTLFVVSF